MTAEDRSTWPWGCWNAYIAAPLDPREAARRITEAPAELQERLRGHWRTVEAVRRHHARRGKVDAQATK
jgi:hypothetical protein